MGGFFTHILIFDKQLKNELDSGFDKCIQHEIFTLHAEESQLLKNAFSLFLNRPFRVSEIGLRKTPSMDVIRYIKYRDKRKQLPRVNIIKINKF